MPRAPAKRRREQPLEHRILLTATLCLLAGGAVMVFSASSAKDVLQGQGDGTSILLKYLVYAGLGLVIMQALARGRLRAVHRATPALLGVAFVLLVMVKLPGFGVSVNGARRWIGAGPLTFQPSELMKLALVLYSVRMLAAKPRSVRSLRALASPLLAVVGAAALLVASQPDIGTALVIAFTIAAILVSAGMPLRHLAVLGGVAFGFLVMFALVFPHVRSRLTSFTSPWSHAGSSGFQAVQGQIAIGSGGLFGVGPGRSVQKIFYLPEANSDFILAVIGEELGVIGVTALLMLYGLIAYAGLRAAKAAKGAYATLLGAGITSLILCQALLNVFAVLGIAPLTGVPLPFISNGSSNLLVLLAAMGLLLNVAAGGAVHLRAVKPGDKRRLRDADDADHGGDRGRRHGGARRAGAGGRRRAAG